MAGLARDETHERLNNSGGGQQRVGGRLAVGMETFGNGGGQV